MGKSPQAAVDVDPLVGRENDLERILERLQRSRLVTLTGPGGTGKTRLAEAAVERARRVGGEAWFVDASAVREPSLIYGTLVSTLRLDAEGPDDPLDVIAAALGRQDVLVALDNLEQIQDVASTISALLNAVPTLQILATSRIRLGARGEIEVAVPTLELPSSPEVAAVESSAAGALFLLRARANGRLEMIDESVAADIATLLRRLDGLPLAIELAAARTRIMTPSEIVSRLERHGLAAIDQPHGDPHRSLAGILDWTLDLLTPDEATVLNAVSICAAFDLALAEELTPGLDVVGSIDSLLSLGLVRATGTAGGATRFGLLETVRAEVLNRLPQEAAQEYRNRHVEAVVKFVAMELTREGSGETDALERLDVEADNIRSALDQLDATDPARSLELWNQLFYPFWASRVRLREGMKRFERTSALLSEPTPQLSRAMVRYAMNAAWVHDEATSRLAMTRALEVAQKVGDRESEIESLTALAATAVNEGDSRLAGRIGDSLTAIELGALPARQQMRVAEARYFVSAVLAGMASDSTLAHLRDAIRFAGSATQPRTETALVGNLAIVHLHRGEYRESVEAAERATALARSLRSPLLPWTLGTLAMARAEEGELAGAVEALSLAIEEALSRDMPLQTCDTLMASMPVALAAGQPLLAARLWGAATALESSGTTEIPPDDRTLAERVMTRVRQRSRSLDVELAIRDGTQADRQTLLSSLVEQLRADSDGASTRPILRHGELTKREVEILTMVGMGMTDPQIAEALFISPKTASVHVANVKAKLGADSRLDVALRARDLGLVADNPRRR